MVEARHIFEDDEDDPRSDQRVGLRLAMAMGAADMKDRDLAEAIGNAMSYETIRRTRKGLRSMRQMELRQVAAVLGPYIEAEVGTSPLEWLQRGPYNGGPHPSSSSGDIPRYIKSAAPAPLATVTDIRSARKAIPSQRAA